MQWRDMAEISREQNPTSRPIDGVCYRSDDRAFTVALVDIGNPSLGWAVWYIGGPTLRILPSVPLGTAARAKALAELLARAVRVFAFGLRVRGKVRRQAEDLRVVLEAMSLMRAKPPAKQGQQRPEPQPRHPFTVIGGRDVADAQRAKGRN